MKTAIKKLFGREEPILWGDPKPLGFLIGNKRVSDLEEVTCLSDDDYLLMTDTSEKKSCRVRLSTLKRFIKS